MRIVYGLDLSLSCTGIAWGKGQDKTEWTKIITKKEDGSHIKRCLEISRYIITTMLKEAPENISSLDFFVESYAYQGFSTILQAELTAIVVTALLEHNINPYMVAPSSLKKWLTGRGNAKKEDMKTFISHKLKISPEEMLEITNDETDAIALVEFGRAYKGHNVKALTKYQKEALLKVSLAYY